MVAGVVVEGKFVFGVKKKIETVTVTKRTKRTKRTESIVST